MPFLKKHLKNYSLSLSLVLLCLQFIFISSSYSLNVKILPQNTPKKAAVFNVEIADTPQLTALGLMFRKKMDPAEGMLFVFHQDRISPFWMKNTFIPLDIIFVDAEKKIVSIVHNAAPETTTPRFPEKKYRYVLEINGGLSKKLGIQAGDVLQFTLPQGK